MIPLFLCWPYLLCNPDCGCVLQSRELSTWFHGDQLPITNNQLCSEYHLTSHHPLLMSVLLLLWFNEFSFSPPLILEILLNVECSKRERQRRMRRFRRRTNRRKINQWWYTNRPTRIYKRHYTDLINSLKMHCTLYFFFVLLRFVRPVHSSMLHLIQFIRLDSHPKLVNTIATKLPIHSVNIDLMRSHILPLAEMGQSWFTSLHLTINKRHR